MLCTMAVVAGLPGAVCISLALTRWHAFMQLLQVTRKRKGKKVTRFAAYLETLFGLSRDYGGPANIPHLQKYLLFQVCICTGCEGGEGALLPSASIMVYCKR